MTERSSVSLEAQGASPEEAAAILVAIVRYAHDVAPPPPRAPVAGGGEWLRAGRLEHAGAGPEELSAWGDPHPWGRTNN